MYMLLLYTFYDTLFEMHAFWPSDTECHIKLTFSCIRITILKTRADDVTDGDVAKPATRNVNCWRNYI